MATDSPSSTEVLTNRRAMIQDAAKHHYRRKVVTSRFVVVLASCALVIAFIPLISIIITVLQKGLPVLSWDYLTTDQALSSFIHPQEIPGGAANAITGSILICGIALVIAIPFGIMLAIALYESTGRVMGALRRYLEVMVGLPSILFGIFIYAYVVTPLGFEFSAFAGSLALALLMVPLMTVACENALRAVPGVLVEAALALGAKRSRIMWRVVLPYSLPRMWTGILLSLSRAVGETAPILFVIGSSMTTSWSPRAEVSSLPTYMYNMQQGITPGDHQSLWGAAVILIVTVFVINLVSRFILSRGNKGR